jgi:hypothetical protein
MGKSSPPQPLAQEPPDKDQRKHEHGRNHVREDQVYQLFSRKDFVRARDRVRSRRSAVSRARLRLQKTRFDLRDLRDGLRKLEANFLSSLEQNLNQVDRDSNLGLSKLFKQVQGMQEKLESQEDAYDEDEDALAEDEDKLDSEERRFQQTYEPDLIPDDEISASPALSSSPSSHPSLLEGRSSSALVDPLLYDYETKIGEANILRERLDELPLRRDEYLQDQLHLKSRGLQLDPHDLHFLDTYEDTYAKHVEDLTAVEGEIQKLGNDAIQKGLLDPSMAYSPFRFQASGPAFPGIQVAMAVDELSNPESVISMVVEDQRTGTTLVDRINLKSGTIPSTIESPKTDIYQWLKNLPSFTIKGVTRKTKKLANRETGWIRSCRNWMPVGWPKENSNGKPPGETNGPQRTQSEQIGKGWVSVDFVYPPETCSHSAPDVSDRPQSIGDFRRQSDGETTPDLDIATTSPPPNAYHDTPLDDLESGLGIHESRSI